MLTTARTCLLGLPLALAVGTAQAEDVEIHLLDLLDNTQNGYCVDIARAQGEAANPDDGLQGHTCYSPSGELMVDQTFDSERLAEGMLYMPFFDVCANVSAPAAGAAIALAACDDGDAQQFVLTDADTITPGTASELCLTVAADTRSGRSDTNQIKVLSLEPCSDDAAARQRWATRTAG